MQSARLNDALVWEEGKGRLYTFVDKFSLNLWLNSHWIGQLVIWVHITHVFSWMLLSHLCFDCWCSLVMMMFFKPSLNPKRVVNGCLSQSKGKVRLSPQSAAATGVSLSIRQPCHLYNMSGRVHVKIYSRRNVFATISNTGISILYKKTISEQVAVRGKWSSWAEVEGCSGWGRGWLISTLRYHHQGRLQEGGSHLWLGGSVWFTSGASPDLQRNLW